MISLLLSLLGCGAPADCADAPCRLAQIEAAWDGTLPSVAPLLDALPDPIERETAVMALVQGGLGEVEALCRQLPAGPGRARCEARTARPHLRARSAAGRPATARPGGGPSAVDLLPKIVGDPQYDGLPSPPLSCGEEPVAPCRTRAAQRAALAGDTRAAAAHCAALPACRDQEECAFKAAEQRLRRDDDEALGASTALCLRAGPFTTACLGHQARAWAAEVPPACTADPAAWAPVRAHGEALFAFWLPRDPAFADFMAQRFWGEVTNHAYAGLPALCGDLLDPLPPVALPQARAAAALRAVELHPGLTLPALHTIVAAGLARRAGGAEGPRAVFTVGALDLWPADAPGEETTPALLYRATARRPVDPDPDVDIDLVLLEAIARQTPPDRALLQAAQAHPAPIVAASATRLLAALQRRPRRP